MLVRRLPVRGRTVLTTCLYGLAAGAVAVAFQLGMNWLYQAGLVRLSHQSHTVFFIGSFILLTGSSLIVAWLLQAFCREAAHLQPERGQQRFRQFLATGQNSLELLAW